MNYGTDVLGELAKPAAQKRMNPFAFGANQLAKQRKMK
jgi:hypothetical protein